MISEDVTNGSLASGVIWTVTRVLWFMSAVCWDFCLMLDSNFLWSISSSDSGSDSDSSNSKELIRDFMSFSVQRTEPQCRRKWATQRRRSGSGAVASRASFSLEMTVSLYGRALRFAIGGQRFLVYLGKLGRDGRGEGVAGVLIPVATVILGMKGLYKDIRLRSGFKWQKEVHDHSFMQRWVINCREQRGGRKKWEG